MTRKKLKVGEAIPAFLTRDSRGNVVDSNAFSSSFTLVVFLRYASCPLCNLALLRLSHEYSLLQKSNCKVIAFVQSTADNIEKNIYGRHDIEPPFPIVADVEQDVYRLFGVNSDVKGAVTHITKNASHWLDASFQKGFPQKNLDGSLFMVPALFLVNPERMIELTDYSANFYDDSTFTPIYERLTFSGGR